MSTSTIAVKITGNASSLSTASKDGASSLDKVGSKARSTGKLLLGAFGAAGVIEAAKSIIGSTDNLETSQAGLDQALASTHQKLSSYAEQIGVVQRQAQKYGFTNADVNNSLAVLTRATGSAEKAIQQQGLVEDIARARKISLASATDLLAKVDTGHIALLGRYGIATKDASGKTLTMQAAVAALTNKFGGAAATQAKTFTGKVQALKAQMTNVEAEIGTKVIPVIEKLATVVMGIIGWFSKGSIAAKAVEVALGLVTVALIANKVATIAAETWNAIWAVGVGVATAAQWVLNAAVVAGEIAMAGFVGPILLVIAGIALLAVGIYEAYKHFGPFHDAVQAVWEALQVGFDWVKSHWPLLLAILTGPIGLAVLLIARNWSTIVSGAEGAFDAVVGFVKGLPGRLLGYVSSLTGAGLRLGGAILSGIISGVSGALGKVADLGAAIANAGIKFVNVMLGDIRGGIRDLANALANVNVPGVGRAFDAASSALNSVASHIPNIPSFGTGGIVPGAIGAPQLIIAHGGENVQTQAQQAAGGGVHYWNVNIYESTDPTATARNLRTFARRNGVNFT